MAADYPFRKIIGVELLPALNSIAQENIAHYHSESQKCFALESICVDAIEFVFPIDPTVLFLFNPLPESGLTRVITNLTQSLKSSRRPAYVLYHNPLLAHILEQNEAFRKVVGTHQYAIYVVQ